MATIVQFRQDWALGHGLRGPSAHWRPAHYLHFAQKERLHFLQGQFRLYGKPFRIEPSFTHRASCKSQQPLSVGAKHRVVLGIGHIRVPTVARLPLQ